MDGYQHLSPIFIYQLAEMDYLFPLPGIIRLG